MPSSTSRSHTAAEERLDLIFHALSDRTRRAVLARLTAGPAMVTELAEPFAMSLPAVSKHLRVLERAGLIERSVTGRVHQCSFGAAPLGEVERWLERTRAFWDGKLDALASYVEGDADTRAKRRKRK